MSLIEARDIVKIYKIGEIEVNALCSLSISIEKGEFVAIMGPSGSGKSTFMNIIGCLDTTTSGHCLFDGVDVSTLKRDELSSIRNKKVGFVFQGYNLLPRTTAVENVELPMLYNGVPSRDRRLRAQKALKAVGLEGKEYHRPNQLSGGQQQRVAIARAIVNNASLILADEPTGNLDSKTAGEIMELFDKLNVESNITIVIVTHEYDIAAHARRIIKFFDGCIVNDEPTGKS